MNGPAAYLNNLNGLELEKTNFLVKFFNEYIIGKSLNAFPKFSTCLLSKGKCEFAKLLFDDNCNKFSFRLFEEMYKYPREGKGDLINTIMMETPAIKAARNRRKISQYILENEIKNSSQSPILVGSIGGGNGRLEIEAISRARRNDVFYCCVDCDPLAAEEGNKVSAKFAMSNRTLFVEQMIKPREIKSLQEIIKKANKKFKGNFNYFDILLCLGIAEYQDLRSSSNEELNSLISGLRNYARREGKLLIDETDFHDRVRYMEKGLNWYMRLRGKEETKKEVEKAGWDILYCKKEPMDLITIILAQNLKP